MRVHVIAKARFKLKKMVSKDGHLSTVRTGRLSFYATLVLLSMLQCRTRLQRSHATAKLHRAGAQNQTFGAPKATLRYCTRHMVVTYSALSSFLFFDCINAEEISKGVWEIKANLKCESGPFEPALIWGHYGCFSFFPEG